MRLLYDEINSLRTQVAEKNLKPKQNAYDLLKQQSKRYKFVPSKLRELEKSQWVFEYRIARVDSWEAFSNTSTPMAEDTTRF